MANRNTAESYVRMEHENRETMRIVIPPKQSKVRLDIYLTHQVENATRSKVQKAINDGSVLVNGKTVKPNHIVSPNEIIDITFPKPPRPEAKPENIPRKSVV